MKRARTLFIILASLIAIPVIVSASIQTQRAQITVTITINVTPAPLALVPRAQSAATDTSQAEHSGIVAALSINQGEKLRPQYHAENVSYVGSEIVAQTAAQQKSVRVDAEVSPNPNGTLLVSNQTGVIINQTAGTTMTYSCIYTVKVTTTVTNWSLDHGLYSDFLDPTLGVSFAGSDVSNNSYLSTPHPAYTPFIVFSDGQAWALLQANGTTKTYCVDLKVALPASAAQGSYASQATYTLLY